MFPLLRDARKHYIQRITTSQQRSAFRKFVNTYHSYIKDENRPSRELYWLLYENDILVGAFGFGSAFNFSKYIKNFMNEYHIEFNELAYNIVYCLYGNEDKNAGTIFLSKVRKDCVEWWKGRYGDTIKGFQSFILPPRTGAMYKADNWILLGETTGDSIKTVTVKYPGDKTIREIHKDGSVAYRIKTGHKVEKKLIFVRLVNMKKYKG